MGDTHGRGLAAIQNNLPAVLSGLGLDEPAALRLVRENSRLLTAYVSLYCNANGIAPATPVVGLVPKAEWPTDEEIEARRPKRPAEGPLAGDFEVVHDWRGPTRAVSPDGRTLMTLNAQEFSTLMNRYHTGNVTHLFYAKYAEEKEART